MTDWVSIVITILAALATAFVISELIMMGRRRR